MTFQATAPFDDQAGGRELTFDPIVSLRPSPRWEYRPGSTLLVVWTQARGDYVRMLDPSLGPGLDRLFGSPATNVFMVKLNYWLEL